jgi:transcriptional regulator with XRE-family HTH domain
MTKKSFAALFEAAERHDEYWTEPAIIEFTEALSRWMEAKKVSQAELAAAIGVSQPYISKVLKGNANFTLATMTKLAHALGARVRVQLVPTEDRSQGRSSPDTESEPAKAKKIVG